MQSIKPFLLRENAEQILAAVVDNICIAIEDAYGRLMHSVCENIDFIRNRVKYIQDIKLGRHFSEYTGDLIDYNIDLKQIDLELRSI